MSARYAYTRWGTPPSWSPPVACPAALARANAAQRGALLSYVSQVASRYAGLPGEEYQWAAFQDFAENFGAMMALPAPAITPRFSPAVCESVVDFLTDPGAAVASLNTVLDQLGLARIVVGPVEGGPSAAGGGGAETRRGGGARHSALGLAPSHSPDGTAADDSDSAARRKTARMAKPQTAELGRAGVAAGPAAAGAGEAADAAAVQASLGTLAAALTAKDADLAASRARLSAAVASLESVRAQQAATDEELAETATRKAALSADIARALADQGAATGAAARRTSNSGGGGGGADGRGGDGAGVGGRGAGRG
jgi:hypothetical protein